MKKSTLQAETNHRVNIDDLSINIPKINSPEQPKGEFVNFNKSLLDSMPYPAMFIRRKDKIILAANEAAIEYGARVGGYCWREFGKSTYIADESKEIVANFPDLVPEEFNIKCTFCLGDECFIESPCQNNYKVHLSDKVMDTYWIKVSDEVYFHYLIDITDRMELEETLRQSEQFLKQTQQIAMLGTYSLDILSGEWTCSEVMDIIFGINSDLKKNFDSWTSIIHPDMQDMITNYFTNDVVGNKNNFNKEYKIIRQNDKAERWVHGLGDLIFNENNEPIKMIGTIRDVTERKEEQARLIRNLRLTEVLLKSIPIPVFFLDANALYTGCNEAFTNHLGVTTEDIKGKSVLDVWPSEQSRINYLSDLELISTQGFKTFETTVFDKYNHVRNVIFIKNVFYDDIGDVAGIVGTYIDITDHKLTEDALRKSEQMLLTVINQFPGVVFWKDKQSTYLGCNETFAAVAGLNSSADIIGKNDLELPWWETEAESFRKDDFEVMEKGKSKLHIVEIQHQTDGKVSWFDTSKIPLCDSEGQVIGVIGVSNDITDRKLAEDALKESEEKYRTVANYTDDWEYWIDQQDNFRYCSPSCEKITGYNADEFIQNSDLVYNIIYPDDKKAFVTHKQAEKMAVVSSIECEFRILRHDGAVRWIGHKCQPVYNEKGEFMGIRGSDRDITERKKTEQLLKTSELKYKLLSKNLTDGIFTCRKGIIEYVNSSMCRIFGYHESELEGLNLTQLILSERRENFKSLIYIDSTSNHVNNIEIECITKDHTIIFVEVFLNYVASEKLIYGVMHDITEKKQIQHRNMVKAIIQTEEAERANFSKELHDGLGPLLSTIKLYLQWSERPKGTKTRKEIILKAEQILEEALTTVKEISYKLSPHLLTNYGLTSAVQSFVNKLEDVHTVKIDFQSNIVERIEMEIEVALYRAIIECVNNTIKYAKAKQIIIKLKKTSNQIQLHYKDDGVGFDIEKIFSEKKGLGLFNLQNRIQTIGGEIQLFSELNHGVNYFIYVPLK